MRHATPLLVLAVAVALVGCEAPGFFASAVPRKIPRQHELERVPTLVLVDDPNTLLGDPALKSVVAANVIAAMKTSKKSPELIDPSRLTTYEALQGERFGRLPIDRVGQALGAQQVVYVLIETAGMSRAPGLLQPSGTARVKVIDAATGKRLFPEAVSDGAEQVRGFPVPVKMQAEAADDPQFGNPHVLSRMFAERLGQEVGYVFTDRRAPSPGLKIEEGRQRGR